MSRQTRAHSGMQGARRPGFLGRFLRDREGSTAIEFIALALPFFMLIFAILESCISFAGQEVMANAADDVARQFRTGQIKAADATASMIKTKICAKLEIMVSNDCQNQLLVDLRKYDSFQDAAAVRFTVVNGEVVLTKNNVVDAKGFSVTPGNASTINMLRVFYKWPVMTDFMSRWMANLKDGRTLHFASVTWQNEPFED